MKNITPIQVQEILQLRPEKRYMHSIKRICDFEEMYTLLDENDSWQLAEVDARVMFFIWPAKEYAQTFLQEQWATSKIKIITINEFYSEILTLLKEHNYLLNVFPTNNLSGFVVTVDKFIEDLNSEMEKYS